VAAIGFDDLVALIRYILAEPNEVEAAMLRDALTEIIPGQESRIMSIAAEEWKAEGIQIGEAKGIQIGEAKGRAEGIRIGRAKGIESGKADLLLRQIRRRFGPVSEPILGKVLNATEDQLNDWAENIIDAPMLDAVFGALRIN